MATLTNKQIMTIMKAIKKEPWEIRSNRREPDYHEAIGCHRPGDPELWYLVDFYRHSMTNHTRTWSTNHVRAHKSQDRALIRRVLGDCRELDKTGAFLYEIVTVPPPEHSYGGDPDW